MNTREECRTQMSSTNGPHEQGGEEENARVKWKQEIEEELMRINVAS